MLGEKAEVGWGGRQVKIQEEDKRDTADIEQFIVDDV